jgi:antitoxin YefM
MRPILVTMTIAATPIPLPEGMEMTLEILADADAVARIGESLAALGRGEPGADLGTARQGLARCRAGGA